MFGIDDALLGGVASGLIGGLFGGGQKSGTTSTTVEMDPQLRNLWFGQNGLPSGTQSAIDILNRIYQTNAGGTNPYVAPKLYSLADRAANPYTPTTAGADVYANAGKNMAPQMQAASTGYRSMFNPYIGGTEAALTQNAVDYLQKSLLPTIQSSAISAGGYGGDREALAEGTAAGDVGKGLLGQMAQLRQQGYESDQSRTLQNALANAGFQQQAGANNQQAGLAGMGYGLQARGQDIGQGLSAYQANQAAIANAAGQYGNAAQYEFNQPWSAANQYFNTLSRFPGGNQTTSQPVYTNPMGNALSGFLMGNALFGGSNNSSSGVSPGFNYLLPYLTGGGG